MREERGHNANANSNFVIAVTSEDFLALEERLESEEQQSALVCYVIV